MKHYKIIFDLPYYEKAGDTLKNENPIAKVTKTVLFKPKNYLEFSYKISHGFKKISRILNPNLYAFSLSLVLIVQRDWDRLNPDYYSPWFTIPEHIGYRAIINIFFNRIIFPPTVTNSDEYYQYNQPIYTDEFYQKGFNISAGDPVDIQKLTAAYATPFKYLSDSLPITVEFLFDYEDTLLPLKEECPTGTSKLLTRNHPGYICIDYDPIEKSLRDLRKLLENI